MKQKKWLIGLVALGLVLAACGSGGSKTTSNEPITQKINVASGGELSTLDSAHYTDVYSSDMIGQVVEGLYRQDKNGDPELAMAKAEPQVSEDGLVYTFKLREAKWTNGDPVKAGDFVVAFRNVVDPAYGSSSSNQMDIFKNGRAVREGQATMEEFGVSWNTFYA